ncbi:hypothetical protein VNO77_17871 [Canavalia gladiata]|uniref:Late embryogenesis abundant protein LEA-2 subgroup domain-containing protein n=1 Tax=Canavalia gladiata TaxID=3824 RepID=A0AAN9LJS7_CANGL
MTMDASQNGRGGPSKESLSHQSSSNRYASPPLMAPPQAMYYPPGMGYTNQGPQGLPPHHGYAPGYAPYPNEYGHPPHGYYQAGPYYNGPPNYQNGNAGKAFIRGFILCSCLLFTGLFVATLAMALILHPQLPVYIVESLTVANFNTNPTFTADWNSTITVENNNERLIGLFSDFKLELLHNYDVVATSYIPHFELDKNENKQIFTKPSSNGLAIANATIDEMAKERASGSLPVSLRISSMISFKSASIATRNNLVLAICEDLKLVFQDNTGVASLENNTGTSLTCQLFM